MLQIYEIKSKNALETSKKISRSTLSLQSNKARARNFFRNSSDNLKNYSYLYRVNYINLGDEGFKED